MAGRLPLDANRNTIGEYAITEKTVTFTAGTNENGDQSGTGNPSTIFQVTGAINCKLLAKCTASLAGASATLEVGTSITTAGLIAQTTATNIDINEIWHDATPDASVEAFSVLVDKVVSDDIIATVGTADITAGAIQFVLLWQPLSEDADVVAV